MKRLIKYISVLVASAVVATSCADYLEVDKYFNDRMTLENVFSSQDYTEMWLADTYSHLKARTLLDICGAYNSQHNFCDDMIFGHFSNMYTNVAAGRYEDIPEHADTWGEAYTAIRKATILIQNVHRLKADHHVDEEQIANYEGQARFIRAYMYFMLLRRFGPIPIIGEGIIDYDADYKEVSLPRNSFDECVDFIATEMQKAALLLPRKRDLSTSDANRPTRGAALAARAKALIYGASPWNNPKPGVGDDWTFTDLVDDQGRMLMAQEYNDEKWARAAAAALDVINLDEYKLYTVKKQNIAQTGEMAYLYPKTATLPECEFSTKTWEQGGFSDIDPYQSYRSLFDGTLTLSTNPELIFSRGRDSKNMQNGYGYGNTNNEGIYQALVMHQFPIYCGGWNCHCISLKQFDAYYTWDGKDAPGANDVYGVTANGARPRGFTKTDNDKEMLRANVHLMNADREPRFYASVAYNGATWGNLSLDATNVQFKNYQCFYYRGGNDGYMNGKLWNRTGIGIMKYVHPTDSDINDVWKEKTEPAIRYADVLLWYAEAVNEIEGVHYIPSWDGLDEYELSRDIDRLKQGIQPVRRRAGLPDYDAATYADVDKFRVKLQRERQIEFFAESSRWYDVRRWKIAPVELNKPVYGLSIMFTQSQREAFHRPAELTQYSTLFTNKMYFWPISKTELKRNIRLTQNPGWQTYD